MSGSSSILRSSRREALFVVLVWLAACLYTCGYAYIFAYQTNPPLLWGIPSWVVWGVILPWMVCTAITCWFALAGMRDEDLGDEAAPGTYHP